MSLAKIQSAAELRPSVPSARFDALLASAQAGISKRIQRLFDERAPEAAARGAEVSVVFDAVRDLTERGGKRLRPALLLTAYRALDPRAPLEPALQAGVALELLQSYFLIHDDWMDGDVERRGGPSVHMMLRRRFRDEARGDAAAILAGDYACAMAFECLSALPVTPARTREVCAYFAEMQRAVISGQVLDVAGRNYDIEAMYALKTGSYTVGGPLMLGAILAAAPRASRAALQRFAEPLGVAFQLRDDVLGVFGDTRRTGKGVGSDLQRGKQTLLIHTALSLVRGAARRELERALRTATADRAALRRAVSLIEASGARTWAEARIEELLAEARSALQRSFSTNGKVLLEAAAVALTRRLS